MQGFSSSKKRILIVDDDSSQLDVLRNFLEPTYIVGTVTYGQIALDYVKQYHTDLIILDVLMPVMDGFEIFRALKALPEGGRIPVIFITGKSSRNIVLESISVGVDAYMVKPVMKDALLNKVQDIFVAQDNMLSKKTVLAIDDDVTYLKIINNVLKDTFNIVMINSVKLAKQYLNLHTPDVILLDYTMPQDSGTQMLSYIRTEEKLSDISVIMMTGINDKDVSFDEMEYSPDKFLLKPVSKLDLLKAIISSLNAHGKNLNT